MIRKRNVCPLSTQPIPVDRCRPFSDTTWLLVVIMLDEEGRTWREIADHLKRDQEDVSARIRGAEKDGTLARVRDRLRVHRRIFPRHFGG